MLPICPSLLWLNFPCYESTYLMFIFISSEHLELLVGLRNCTFEFLKENRSILSHKRPVLLLSVHLVVIIKSLLKLHEYVLRRKSIMWCNLKNCGQYPSNLNSSKKIFAIHISRSYNESPTNQQSAFHRMGSTINALLKFLKDIMKSKPEFQYVCLTTRVMLKALDTVYRSSIISALAIIEHPNDNCIINVLKNFLIDRPQFTVFKSAKPSSQLTNLGVRQGNVSGPSNFIVSSMHILEDLTFKSVKESNHCLFWP